MAKYKVLFVDDEENTLAALKRVFYKESDIEIITAAGPQEAVKIISSKNIDLVMSDEKMPKISGTQLIQLLKVKYPNIIRMILTGYANVSSVISAINRGDVYRYLTKPWDEDELKIIIRQALEYGELKKKNEGMNEKIKHQNKELMVLNTNLEERVKERTEQLNKVLKGLKSLNEALKENFQEMVQLLTGFVSMFQMDLIAHSKRVAELTELVCDSMDVEKEEREMIVSSALLHDIGLAVADGDIHKKDPDQLEGDEEKFYLQHPVTGSNIIGSAKTMSKMAGVIHSHHEQFNGRGFPDGLRGRKIPLGSRIIKISSDYDDFVFKMEKTQREFLKTIAKDGSASFDPAVVDAFLKIIKGRAPSNQDSTSKVRIKDFKPGMYLAQDIILSNGLLLLPQGSLLNRKIVDRVADYSSMINLQKEVRVRV